ncbi:hypothetical protein [Agrobacterium radiobacter]|uniref:hypothetical protein n=1 Tax=Agrobacterium radiobacter TaxID=362 RepID=UPI0007619D6A|nr:MULTISPECIES: hypothetical protein [Agrobacterium tumefaciens complex]KAB0459936.1 hypothetical protein F7R04_13675 [Agrobacterium tumefaciens]KWT76931.1 hypothetical protein ASH09_11270 [Agrobacterium radiobacter]NIB11292.1 hypothetical protein [Agrobacterium radiobacter]OOO38411.1 hypothetical protein BS628_09780 [Agrobacterium radiobacter]
MSDFNGLIPGRTHTSTCAECGSIFEKKSKARRVVCSAACKRKRALRYGEEYRQNNRDLRAKIYAMFGDKAPTQAELIDFIKSRKRKEIR